MDSNIFENLTYDKLKWNASDLGELNDKDFVLSLEALLGTKDSELKDEEFKSNGLYYIDNEGDKQSVKVSIFKYNDMNVVIDKLKPDFSLPHMSYMIFNYNGNRYLMSQDSKDEYTNRRILRSYTNAYLTSIRKTLAFQWIFAIKCTNLDKTISRVYDIPTEFNIDGSHIVSCFETGYKYNVNNNNLPRLMINSYFDKKDDYFYSTCQHLLCEGYTDVNLYILHIKDKVKEYWPDGSKLNTAWFNKCAERMRHIFDRPIINDLRYHQMGILMIPQNKNIIEDK
jgi:hypothetical protein